MMPKAGPIKEKLAELDCIKIEDSCSLKDTVKNKAQTERKYFQISFLTMDVYPVHKKMPQILIIIEFFKWTKNLNQRIMNESLQMTSKHMEICSTLLANHLPIPVAKEKGKIANIKCW